jgi:hypothetical protein
MVAEPGGDLRSHTLTSGFVELAREARGAGGPTALAEEYGWAALKAAVSGYLCQIRVKNFSP